MIQIAMGVALGIVVTMAALWVLGLVVGLVFDLFC